MISVCGEHASNVKRWRDGQMALRWCAAGMVEPASNSAASTATCTYPTSAPRCVGDRPNPSPTNAQ